MPNRNSLKESINSKILRSRRNVFVRAEFKDISNDYDQVGLALRALVKENVLIKIGYGLYAKARINRFTSQSMPAAKGGVNQVITEALSRLKVNFLGIRLQSS